ncbi:MAG: cell envelope biogenesis protein OmpA, partial [Flavobacteriaceae bacterium]|nr:cell envelope biogenesis protein OmpA [Flavobacteriaceae bacterium]
MKDSDKLELLKKLLLDEEREVAETITQKVQEIDKTMNVEDNLGEKVYPIIT